MPQATGRFLTFLMRRLPAGAVPPELDGFLGGEASAGEAFSVGAKGDRLDKRIPRRSPAVSLDRVAYHNQAVLDAQYHYVLTFGGRLDEMRLERALRLVMDAEPVFGCRYVASRAPYWRRREDLDTLCLCEVVECSDAHRELTEFVARPCDAAVDPLIQVCILRGVNDTLCLKINHAACDAAGGKELLTLIAGVYHNLRDDPDYRVTPNLGSRSRMQLFRQLGLKTCWKSFWKTGRGGGLKPRPSLWQFPSANREDRGAIKVAIRRLTPAEFDAIRSYAKPRGATLNDVLAAAYFRSLCHFLEPGANTPQSIFLPLDLRRYLTSGKTQAVCNFITVFPLSLARVPDEPFEATLQRVTKKTSDAEARKERAIFSALIFAAAHRLRLPQIKKRVEAAARASVQDGRTSAFLSNNGTLEPQALDFELPLLDAYTIAPAAFPPGLFVLFGSFRRTLTFTAVYCSRAVKTEAMEAFLDAFLGQLPHRAAPNPMAQRSAGTGG